MLQQGFSLGHHLVDTDAETLVPIYSLEGLRAFLRDSRSKGALEMRDSEVRVNPFSKMSEPLTEGWRNDAFMGSVTESLCGRALASRRRSQSVHNAQGSAPLYFRFHFVFVVNRMAKQFPTLRCQIAK
jgi:hypothetical protein